MSERPQTIFHWYPAQHRKFYIAPREPWCPGKGLLSRGRMGLALGKLLTGNAPDQPGVAGELLMHPFEDIPGRTLRAPAAWKRPTVDGCRTHNGCRERFQWAWNLRWPLNLGTLLADKDLPGNCLSGFNTASSGIIRLGSAVSFLVCFRGGPAGTQNSQSASAMRGNGLFQKSA